MLFIHITIMIMIIVAIIIIFSLLFTDTLRTPAASNGILLNSFPIFILLLLLLNTFN